MPNTLPRRITVGLGVAAALLLGVGGVAYRTAADLVRSGRRVDHAHRVHRQLDALLQRLDDAESGQRGDRLTGQPRYLPGYQHARGDVAAALTTLHVLTADEPAQQIRLATLAGLARETLAALEQTAALQRTAGSGPAAAVVATERGRRAMDQVRGVVGTLRQQEDAALADASVDAAAAGRHTQLMLLLVLALALGGGGLAGWSLLREVRARARLADDLRAERSRLAAVLAQLPAGVVVADAGTGQLVFGNAHFAEIWRRPFTTGLWPAGSADGVPAWMRFTADGAPAAPAPLAEALARGESVLGEEVPLARADGTSGVQRVHAAPVRDALGRVVAGVAVVEDVTALHEARAAAARATAQLAQLQHLTAALGAALAVEQIGDIVVGRVTAVLGAAAGALAVADPATGAVRFVRTVGYPAEANAAAPAPGHPLPPGLGLPVADAVRTGRPVYLATAEDWRARYPTAASDHEACGYQGAAVLPCLAAGEVLGVVTLSFAGPCPLVRDDRVLGETLAAQCAQALYRARLLDAQERARGRGRGGARGTSARSSASPSACRRRSPRPT